MNEVALWHNTQYVSIVTCVVLFFLVGGGFVYIMQLRDSKWIAVWAAMKSWVVTSPLAFFFAALPTPWPLVFVCGVAILGAKTFFQMTGMYHRSWFIWTTYIFILVQGFSIYRGYDRFFNIMPMIYFVAVALIPIFRNSATQMIQYMALSLMNFILMGWGFMHLGRIVLWSGGPLIALYILILCETCETANYTITRLWGKHKPLEHITTRSSIEGFVGSLAITVLLAWGIRHMLPHGARSEHYWIAAAFSVAVVGRIGGILLTVIRRDLGIKDSGIFIIGRDDILARIDAPILATPAFYFIYLILDGTIHI
jgi:phosphatidate cytidylyltransferase